MTIYRFSAGYEKYDAWGLSGRQTEEIDVAANNFRDACEYAFKVALSQQKESEKVFHNFQFEKIV